MSRRARQINDLKRNRAKQASYDRVLIVCGGSKTEPNYFREIIDHLKLNTANVEVDGSSDLRDPILGDGEGPAVGIGRAFLDCTGMQPVDGTLT